MASARPSMPSLAAWSRSVSRQPYIRSIVRTREVVVRHTTRGISIFGSSRKSKANRSATCASTRRSSSRFTESSNSASSACRSRSLSIPSRRTPSRSLRASAMSPSTAAAAPGRTTFTTTCVPADITSPHTGRTSCARTAPCTWAIEAEAIGSSSKLAKSCSGVRPNSSRITCRMTDAGSGDTESCMTAISATISRENSSGRTEISWPSLMNAGPSSANASRHWRANAARRRAAPVSPSPERTAPASHLLVKTAAICRERADTVASALRGAGGLELGEDRLEGAVHLVDAPAHLGDLETQLLERNPLLVGARHGRGPGGELGFQGFLLLGDHRGQPVHECVGTTLHHAAPRLLRPALHCRLQLLVGALVRQHPCGEEPHHVIRHRSLPSPCVLTVVSSSLGRRYLPPLALPALPGVHSLHGQARSATAGRRHGLGARRRWWTKECQAVGSRSPPRPGRRSRQSIPLVPPLLPARRRLSPRPGARVAALRGGSWPWSRCSRRCSQAGSSTRGRASGRAGVPARSRRRPARPSPLSPPSTTRQRRSSTPRRPSSTR